MRRLLGTKWSKTFTQTKTTHLHCFSWLHSLTQWNKRRKHILPQKDNNQNITTGPLSFHTDLKFLSFTLGRDFSGRLRCLMRVPNYSLWLFSSNCHILLSSTQKNLCTSARCKIMFVVFNLFSYIWHFHSRGWNKHFVLVCHDNISI